MTRGILEPKEKLTGKDQEVYYLANMSSFLDGEHNIDDAAVEEMNKKLGNLGESITQISFDEKKQTTIEMGKEEETAISSAAVPEPDTKAEVYSFSISKALSNFLRIVSMSIENSFSR